MNKTLDRNYKVRDSGIEWIGEIPIKWKVKKMKHISSIKTGKKDVNEGNLLGSFPFFTCSKTPSRSDGYSYDCEALLVAGNGSVGYTHYYNGKFEAYQRTYIICDFTQEIGVSFLKHYTSSLLIRCLENKSNGSVIDFIKLSDMKNFNIVSPPLYEQQAIANYLDEQVGKIDELIAEQKQAIESWKAYKQSLITEKVTKGLNLGVEMKDSGIDWIGNIPEEWRVIRYKNICYVFAGGTPKTDVQEYWDGDIPWIASGRVQNCLITEPTRYITNLGIINSSTKMLKRGTPVLAMTGATCGNTGFLGIDTCANQSVMAFVPRKNDAFGKFIFYSLMAHRHVILGEQFGGAQAGLSTEKGRNLQITLPPLHEQQAIANYLDEKVGKIDELIEQKQVFIKQLEEYKQSLIYECVTGKRCVL